MKMANNAKIKSHEYWMAKALKLAEKGRYSTDPNPVVGCIIVKEDELLAQGWHQFPGGSHAEINAINSVSNIPSGCDFYISLEPCSHKGKTPPCVDAVILCQPAQVFIAMQDPNPLVAGKSVDKLKQQNIKVNIGLLREQAETLNPGFYQRMRESRPFVRLKMASSLDGRTALANGESQWITGEAARRDVQFLRARSSAILTSADTVKRDNPRLNVRLDSDDLDQQQAVRQPVRLIVDSQLKLTGKEQIFQHGKNIIFTTIVDKVKQANLKLDNTEVFVLDQTPEGFIDLRQMMSQLASMEINEIHTECGQRLAGALLQQSLVDEIVLYIAPCLLGCDAKGLFNLGSLTKLSDKVTLSVKQLRLLGEDIRITATVKSNHFISNS